METKKTCESCTFKASIIVDVAGRDLVSGVIEEVLAKDLNSCDFSNNQNKGLGKKLIFIGSILTSLAISLGYWFWQDRMNSSHLQ